MWLYRRIVWWYLAAPVMLFLLQWYNHLIGFPLFCALLFAVDHVSQYSDLKNPDGSRYRHKVGFLPPILTISLSVLVTWGALAANYYDWQKHRALFFDLERCAWPIGYVWNDIENVMSYYLPYYLMPAFVAKVFGTHWLSAAVQIWTLMGYGLVFWGYFSRSRNFAEWLILLFIVFSFAGWDFLGWRWQYWEWPKFHEHLIVWNGLEIHSNIFTFYWVPQHAIPAWLSGILLFRPELSAKDKARFGTLLLALVTYWSPLVGVGLFFLVALDLLYANPFKALIQNKFMFAMSMGLVVPYAFYLNRNLNDIYSTWAFYNWDYFVPYYCHFLFFTILIMYLVVYLLAGVREQERYLNLCLIIFLLAPLYCFGMFNDLAMRGPMVEYFFLLMLSGDGALKMWRHLRTHGVRGNYHVLKLVTATAILMISSITAINESYYPALAIKEHRFFSDVRTGLLHLYAKDDNRYQYMTRINPTKMKLMEDIRLCLP